MSQRTHLRHATFEQAGLPAIQRGVGLLEVLIAILILAIGFLGLAALEARSLSTNNSAMARSMATMASYSILDAMRADVANARAGSYNQTVTANACPSTADTLANTQLRSWCNQLGERLGKDASTKGTINCSNTGSCTVTIIFDDSRGGEGGDSDQTISTKAML